MRRSQLECETIPSRPAFETQHVEQWDGVDCIGGGASLIGAERVQPAECTVIHFVPVDAIVRESTWVQLTPSREASPMMLAPLSRARSAIGLAASQTAYPLSTVVGRV